MLILFNSEIIRLIDMFKYHEKFKEIIEKFEFFIHFKNSQNEKLNFEVNFTNNEY